jgi:hypothetical protein
MLHKDRGRGQLSSSGWTAQPGSLPFLEEFDYARIA